nr:Retrovirus-related Pol polyprotein from transposon TNT 1-94 [Ipomoea batatas]
MVVNQEVADSTSGTGSRSKNLQDYCLAGYRSRRTNVKPPSKYGFDDMSLGDSSFIFMLLYVDDMLISAKSRFGMSKSKLVSTPLANHFKLSSSQYPQTVSEIIENMTKVPYASTIGCLMYAMVCTRPDLAHAVSEVIDNPPMVVNQEVADSTSGTGSRSKNLQDYCLAGYRSRRTNVKPPSKYGFDDMVFFALLVTNNDLVTFQVAISSYEKDRMAGMIEDMESLHQNHTLELVRLSQCKKTIECKWVYRKKPPVSGKKKGNIQESVSYERIFSPECRLDHGSESPVHDSKIAGTGTRTLS